MKAQWKKVMAGTLCAALVIGGAHLTAMAVPSQDSGAAQDSQNTVSTQSVAQVSAAAGKSAYKDETVYVLTGADGSVEKRIVSDWLKNANGDATLKDRSDLQDIENVKGDETWSANGANLSWAAAGNDIYYQGTTDKELPVDVKISYTLDGKTVSPADLAGKSGKVSIRFDYANRAAQTAEVDGEEVQIFVPFAMLTGVVLDNEVFSNVEVTHGKLINDGDRSVVVGMAFPGLQESLNLNPETLELPDYVEITADVQDFALAMTMTVATNQPFQELDLSDLSDLDGLSDSMDSMTDAMAQLMDGSDQLYDGLSTLADKSNELADGVGQLQDGAKQLEEGLNTLTANNASLTGGAKQVFETLLSTANTQLAAAGLDVPTLTIENYGTVLDQVVASLDEDKVHEKALETVTAAVEAQHDYIEQQVTAAVEEQVSEKVNEAVRAQVTDKVTAAVKEQVTSQVTAAVQEQVTAKVTEAAKAQVVEQVTAAAKEQVTEKVTAAVKEQVTAQVTAAVQEQVSAQVKAAVQEQVMSKVVSSAAHMDLAAYQQAVAAGMVDSTTQAAVEAAVQQQMSTAAIAETITAKTTEQMATSEVQQLISSNTEDQMKSETVQATIASNVEEQMKTKDVQALIDTNVAEQMKTEQVQSLIQSNVETQMATEDIQATIAANVEEQMAKEDVQALIPKNVEEQMATEDVQSLVTANIDEQMATDNIQETIADNTEEQVQKAITDNMGSEEVLSQMAAASEGVKSVLSLKASLDSYNTFYTGLQTYTAGVAQAADGAGELKAGTDTLNNAMPDLLDGVGQLKDGAKELADGLAEFNEEAIEKLVSAVDEDLAGLSPRLEAVRDAANSYRNYAGLADGADGEVKFIFRTDAI